MELAHVWGVARSHYRGSVRGGLCSPLPSTFYPVLPAPFHFSALAPFCQFSLLLFHLSSLPAPFLFFLLLPEDFSCSLPHFSICCCSLLPLPNFCAPCSQITFSMLLAPLGLKGHSPCSLITPNGGSEIEQLNNNHFSNQIKV